MPVSRLFGLKLGLARVAGALSRRSGRGGGTTLPGRLLTGVQRLLNVDGYQVFAVDEISGTVALNRQLLNAQFQLESV